MIQNEMDIGHFNELIKTIRDSTAKNWFDYFISIGSFIISIAAIMIGIRISKKLSLKAKILEKQLETVFSLLNILQHQRFHLDITLEGWIHHTSILEIVKDKTWKDITEAAKRKLPIYFEWPGYHEFSEILSYQNNAFLPISISKQLDKFNIHTSEDIKVWDIEINNLPQNYVIHTANVKENHKNFERHIRSKSELKVTDYILYKDFHSFVTVCNDLVYSIESWLKKFEATNINLNLKSKHSLPY